MTDPTRTVWWRRTIATIGFPPMAHRPPLPRRWALYCVVAYLLPIVLIEALPDGAGLYKEIAWLTTLAPAFILSLHFGMMGALAGLLAGTVLYLAVQLVLELSLMPMNPGWCSRSTSRTACSPSRWDGSPSSSTTSISGL